MSSGSLATDQRGQPRVVDNPDFPNAAGSDGSDIGAFEADATLDDGLPNSWELQYFGTIAFGPDEDMDGDGMSNLAELLAGTNPMNPGSALRITSVDKVGANVLVKFLTTTNHNYVVQYAPVVPTNNWTMLVSNVPGTDGFVTVTNLGVSTQPKRFYRVRLQ